VTLSGRGRPPGKGRPHRSSCDPTYGLAPRSPLRPKVLTLHNRNAEPEGREGGSHSIRTAGWGVDGGGRNGTSVDDARKTARIQPGTCGEPGLRDQTWLIPERASRPVTPAVGSKAGDAPVDTLLHVDHTVVSLPLNQAPSTG
jgi:hypothetical protein